MKLVFKTKTNFIKTVLKCGDESRPLFGGKVKLMTKCEVCGNDYYLAFQVVTAGATHVFDCFECAIHKLAPICEHCGVKIIGHGVEANNTFYCCANCARQQGATEATDHVWGKEIETAQKVLNSEPIL